MQWLVSQGAAIDASGSNGYQPLHCASEKGQLETVQWLVLQGAAIDALTTNGETALQRAQIQGHHNVVAFLKRMSRRRTNKQQVKPVALSQEEANQAEQARQLAEQELLAMLADAEGEGQSKKKSKKKKKKNAVPTAPDSELLNSDAGARAEGELSVAKVESSQTMFKADFTKVLGCHPIVAKWTGTGPQAYSHYTVYMSMFLPGASCTLDSLNLLANESMMLDGYWKEGSVAENILFLKELLAANQNQDIGTVRTLVSERCRASGGGDLNTVKKLVAGGVGMSDADDHLQPIHHASVNGQFEIVQWLVSQGARD